MEIDSITTMELPVNIPNVPVNKSTKGIRKTSVARVVLNEKINVYLVNKNPIDKYFKDKDAKKALEPFSCINYPCGFSCRVAGGGTTGQSEAIRYALSRELARLNPEFKAVLKKNGFLNCDTRFVERKKTGKRKARKSSQWVRR